MKKGSIQELVLAALFLAFGVALPQLFHLFGLGSAFLPMHIPALLCGFFVSWPYALAVGVLSPAVSHLLTGMPPAFPMLPSMVLELGVYGLLTSLLSKKTKLSINLSLPLAMVGGRLASGLSVWILVTFFAAKLPAPQIFVWNAIITGLPGITIQLLFIPLVVSAVKRAQGFALEGGRL